MLGNALLKISGQTSGDYLSYDGSNWVRKASNTAYGPVELDGTGKIPSGLGTGSFGAWTAVGYGPVQATTDGFLQGYINVGNNSGWASYMYAYTDAAANPTTIHGYAFGISPGYPYDVIERSTFLMPVRKNDYWKVVVTTLTGGGPSVSLYWLPLG